MKGTIALCLKNMIKDRFGEDKWKVILQKSGLNPNMSINPTQDIDDDTFMKVVNTSCSVLNVSYTQAADAFGDYWMNSYAPNIYVAYFMGLKSAREFLLSLDSTHEMVTRSIENAHPPRFQYHWKDNKTLIMTYMSHRDLIDFVVGLIKGVGHYFDEDLKVTKIDADKVEIIFK